MEGVYFFFIKKSESILIFFLGFNADEMVYFLFYLTQKKIGGVFSGVVGGGCGGVVRR
ncbi:hypothetical protein [Bartonella taylorii]|uniref:hypothetical protein n=1 Tax=Bartonella taylorii TaxID=33046 RepID=UPI001ABAD5FE|nr:hypothetical protein [Bartonella taylorii]